MGICDRIIPNATLSAVVHKEDEILHKTRKQCTRLKIRLITRVTSWTKRCQKATYSRVYLQWNTSHWQNFTASLLGLRPLRNKIFHYALIYYYYYVHNCEDKVIGIYTLSYPHSGAVYIKMLEGIQDGRKRLLNGGQFSCWAKNLLCKFSEHHSQLKQQTLTTEQYVIYGSSISSHMNLLPREPELNTTLLRQW